MKWIFLVGGQLFYYSKKKLRRSAAEFHQLRSQCSDIVDLIDRIANEYKERYGCGRFLEKTPQHVFHLKFIIEKFPNAKIINVIRDPRDGFVSSKSNPYVIQNSPRSFVKYWKRSVKAREKLADHAAIIDIRYEDFMHFPEKELERIMNALGEEYEPGQIDVKLMSDDPRAGTESFRLLGGEISTASIGRWRSELTANEADQIKSQVGRFDEYLFDGVDVAQ